MPTVATIRSRRSIDSCSLSRTRLVPPGYDIAQEAAQLRAGYGLRVPDALLLATALHEDAQAFLTNDTRLRRLKAEGLTVMVLADYA
jgi:predicted nucleic acid-binding protein